jgi:hypothetical protein
VRLFGRERWPALRLATADLSWLLTSGYATPSALKLVGDRHNLTERQRIAVMRCACSDEAVHSRLARHLNPEQVQGRSIAIDGYNLLTTIETALAGGVVLVARDSCWRDMASMHGTYRKVDETQPALESVGQSLAALRTGPVAWYLDRPVSNSGRLATVIRQLAAQNDWNWQVNIVNNPDTVLIDSKEPIVITADSVVLDRCATWFNLARMVLQTRVPDAWTVDLTALPTT